MIQVDDSVHGPAWRGRTAQPAEQDPAQSQLNRAPPDKARPDEEGMLLISRPPAPFPRILPGL